MSAGTMSNWTLFSEHRPTGKGLLQTTWPFLMLGGFALFFGFMMQFVRTQPGEETATRMAGVVAMLGSFALLGVAPWRFFQSAANVRVYKEGLQWQQGGREHQQTWADVLQVYRKELHLLQGNARPSDWNRKSELRLVFADGSQASFNHVLSDYSQLASFVQQATAEHLLPLARESMQGAGMTFGTIQLTREGLSLGHEVFPIETLRQLRVGNGYLIWIDARGFKRELPLKDLPNYPVLLCLLEEMRRASAKQPDMVM
jgi:hypothetical protein